MTGLVRSRAKIGCRDGSARVGASAIVAISSRETRQIRRFQGVTRENAATFRGFVCATRRVGEIRAGRTAECALPGERHFVDAAVRYLEEQIARKGREGRVDERSIRALDHVIAAG